jgi:hypothetical protein
VVNVRLDPGEESRDDRTTDGLHARSSAPAAAALRGEDRGCSWWRHTELVFARTVFAVVIAPAVLELGATTVRRRDVNVDARPIPSRDPIAQTGCLADEKCA